MDTGDTGELVSPVYYALKDDSEQEPSKDQSICFRSAIWLALIVAQMCSAAYSVITMGAISGSRPANPLIFSFLRDILAFPLILLAAVIFEGPSAVMAVPTRANLPRLFFCGLLGMFLNPFFYIAGLCFIDGSLAAVVNLLTAVFAFALSTSLGLEKFSWLQAAGVALSVLGAMVMCNLMDPETYKGHSSILWGSLFVMGSCASYSTYLVILRPLAEVYRPVSVTAWCYCFGSLWMTVVSLAYVPWTPAWARSHDMMMRDPQSTVAQAWQLDSTTWIAIGVAVGLNSMLKFTLTTFANPRVTVGVLAMFGTLVPILTYVFEVLANVEVALTLSDLGGLAVLAGLAMVVLKKNEDEPNAEEFGPVRRRCLSVCAGRRLGRLPDREL